MDIYTPTEHLYFIFALFIHVGQKPIPWIYTFPKYETVRLLYWSQWQPQCSQVLFCHRDKCPSEVQQSLPSPLSSSDGHQLPRMNLRRTLGWQSHSHLILCCLLYLLICHFSPIIMHVLFLHETGSHNPSGISTGLDNIPFHPHYTIKDILGLSFLIPPPFILAGISPDLLWDPDSYIAANPFNTSPHISQDGVSYARGSNFAARADHQRSPVLAVLRKPSLRSPGGKRW